MPVIASAKKAMRKDVRRTAVNRRIRNHVKTALDKAKAEPSVSTLAASYSALDRAAKKNVMHKNKAARLKSRLTKASAKPPAVKAKTATKKKVVKRTKKS
jgi:small subunit ribosomal protein S20